MNFIYKFTCNKCVELYVLVHNVIFIRGSMNLDHISYLHVSCYSDTAHRGVLDSINTIRIDGSKVRQHCPCHFTTLMSHTSSVVQLYRGTGQDTERL